MYRWIDHTAEVELAIEAHSEREVFTDGLAALAELLEQDGRGSGAEVRAIALSAPDRPTLLAAWLEELVFLAESEGFVATAVGRLELSDRALSAEVRGFIGDPPPLVKAVTYHRLALDRGERGYVARVVLDV